MKFRVFFDGLAIEFSLGAIGALVAVLVLHATWALPFVFLIIPLIQKSLALPILQHAASRDPKTQLHNAAYLSTALDQLFSRSVRSDEPLAVVVIDLDFLHDLNSRHGHLGGDAVIVGVADVIRTKVRSDDIVARFGGDEYVIILPGASIEVAEQIAERIREDIAARVFARNGETAGIRATVSIGVSTRTADTSTTIELLRRADEALYHAKAQGGNTVLTAVDEIEQVLRRQMPRIPA